MKRGGKGDSEFLISTEIKNSLPYYCVMGELSDSPKQAKNGQTLIKEHKHSQIYTHIQLSRGLNLMCFAQWPALIYNPSLYLFRTTAYVPGR